MQSSFLYFFMASIAEIIGCYAFWIVLRENKGSAWLVLGLASLAVFAYLLTKVNLSLAGRAYAAYGGIYIAASILWLTMIEGTRPNQWDIAGTSLSIAGTAIILFGNLVK